MAKLFVAPKQPVEHLPDEELERDETESFEIISGDTVENLETALRALSFLLAWANEIGPEGLQNCADRIRAFREAQS